MRTIRRVAVLGAGTMGARIAAHFANAGIPALLLDIVLPDQPNRNTAALKGIESAARQKPGGFFTDGARSLVTPGNFEDDLDAIRDCDWVLEAVLENLEVKRKLLEEVARRRKPGSILSTNTSGLPLARIAEGFPAELRRNFLGTHFFNPPRYLHLLEVIPGPETDPAVLQFAAEFCDRRLGKGVVRCKDTPNFIANRIGSFFGTTIHQLTVEGDYSIEEADALTGPLIGLPRSASFRLVDIIGLDTWAHVGRNLHSLVPEDSWRERFLPPEFLERMVERGWRGEKSGQGFYKRVGAEKEIWAIDWKTLEYHPARKVSFASVEAARGIANLPDRLKALVASEDRAGTFLWKLFSDVFLYAAERVPEISDRIVEVDRAMRWGYAHSLGPFELWDALGVEETVSRMERDGRTIPDNVARMLAAGARSFYRAADRDSMPRTEYFDLVDGRYAELEARPGVVALSELKRARGTVRENAGASLVDLGDGVLCLEFDARKSILGEEQIEMICAGIEEAARNHQALVFASQGESFSLGLNLRLILGAARDQKWDELGAALARFQTANMAIKYASMPVVAAPLGMTLGAACEVALHAARIEASAETYMGLIPAGGGLKELLLRIGDPKRVLELVSTAKISSSAEDARQMGFLGPQDGVSMNPERLLADAKALALGIVPSYAPGVPRTKIKVAGESGFATLKRGAFLAQQAGYISEYGLTVAEKIAQVLSGGRLTGAQEVSEQYLLDLEREAFLSLCGQAPTQQRIEHMLKTGKPLRN